MRTVGILCWWDEQPAWLASSVASFCQLGLDHLVAVDGAYNLVPEGSPKSGAEQHQALLEMVRPFGVGLTLHVPNKVWDSEVEKRSKAFSLAEKLTDEEDWYVVFDVDEMAEHFDLKRALANTDRLVGECESWERVTAPGAVNFTETKQIRRFYRALRGLHVDQTHTTYRAGDLTLRGFGEDQIVAAERVPMRVEHRWNFQDPQRRLRQQTYYRLRDEAQIEQRKCRHCERQSVITAPTKFRKGGGDKVVCQWVEVCERHIDRIIKDNERTLTALGVDPDDTMIRSNFNLNRARWLAASTSDQQATRVASQA